MALRVDAWGATVIAPFDTPAAQATQGERLVCSRPKSERLLHEPRYQVPGPLLPGMLIALAYCTL
jgi:hypothetical protein